jgi:hypothetical protein
MTGQRLILILLNVLMGIELLLTLLVTVTYLRMQRRRQISAMRQYLLARAAFVMLSALSLWMWPNQIIYLSKGHWGYIIYYYWYWGSAFLLLFLEIRVAVAATASFFDEIYGLQSIFRLIARWLAVATLIFILPLSIAIVLSRFGYAPLGYMHLIRRWASAYPTVELIPVICALLAALIRGVSWTSKTFGILIGFLFEPASDLLAPWAWFGITSMLAWANVAHETACCLALGVWLIYFLKPERAATLAPPSPLLMRWDEAAQVLVRLRTAGKTAKDAAPRGGRPWPKDS